MNLVHLLIEYMCVSADVLCSTMRDRKTDGARLDDDGAELDDNETGLYNTGDDRSIVGQSLIIPPSFSVFALWTTY